MVDEPPGGEEYPWIIHDQTIKLSVLMGGKAISSCRMYKWITVAYYKEKKDESKLLSMKFDILNQGMNNQGTHVIFNLQFTSRCAS